MLQKSSKQKNPSTSGSIKFNRTEDIEISYSLVLHKDELVLTLTEPRDENDEKYSKKKKRQKFSENVLRTVLPITDTQSKKTKRAIYQWFKEMKDVGEISLGKEQAQDLTIVVLEKVEDLLEGLGLLILQ